MDRNDFRHGAVCRDYDPEVWFPINEATGSGPAKALCQTCPVRQRCLDWAVSTGQTAGVWGGLTTDERAELRRPAAAAAAVHKAANRRPVALADTSGDSSARRRGHCTGCRASHPLRADGTIGYHRTGRIRCDGVGGAPVMEDAQR